MPYSALDAKRPQSMIALASARDRAESVIAVESDCLLRAGVVGYPHYSTGLELEHSVDILADLVAVVAEQTQGVFEVVHLEGDAVFVRAPSNTPCNTLLATVEAMYFAFATRTRTISSESTCLCRACRGTADLDLEIILHRGEYVPQPAEARDDLAGSDVAVSRRLTDSVTERFGVRGHALFSDAARETLHLDASAIGMIECHLEHDDIGRLRGWVLDLRARWREAQQRHSVYVATDHADDVYRIETVLAPSLVWEYLTSPTQMALWPAVCSAETNRRGTLGVGSTNHCVHGRVAFDNEMLDWRPYEYFSFRSVDRVLGEFICTDEIRALGDGRWSVEHRVRGLGGRKQRLLLKVFARKHHSVLPWWLGCR